MTTKPTTVPTLKRVSTENGPHSAGNVHLSLVSNNPLHSSVADLSFFTSLSLTSILTRETKHKLSVFTNRETVRATRQAEARGPSPLLARGKTTAWTKRRRWRTRRRTDGAHRPLAMGAGHARVKMKGNDASSTLAPDRVA